jgi:hypothetical protein
MIGQPMKKSVESTGFRMTIEKPLTDWIRAVETWAKNQIYPRSKEVFGKTIEPKDIDNMFVSGLKTDDSRPTSLSMKAGMMALNETKNKYLTQWIIIDEMTEIARVTGWDALKPFFSQYGKFTDASIRAEVDISVWVNSRQFGHLGAQNSHKHWICTQ